MKRFSKYAIFLLLLVALIGFVSAQIGFDNPSLPRVESITKFVEKFLDLEDTPTTYTGSPGYCVVVNSATNGVEFTLCNSTASNSSTFAEILLTNEGNIDNVADILGSEITNDLGWTSDTDTNASTECVHGEYLDGGGMCYDVNETIDAKLEVSYFNATAVSLIEATESGGSLSDTNAYDRVSYNITETSGAPGLDIRFNFTGISDFNTVIVRLKMDGKDHDVNIQLWDYVSDDWEKYATLVEVEEYQIIELGVYDSTEHINVTDGNKVQVRFYMSEPGNTNHEYFFDWVQLSQGPATFSTQEIDPLSWHKNENIDVSNFNITADWATFNNLNVTGTSHLGNLVIQADNISTDNILSLSGSGIRIWDNLGVSDFNVTADWFKGNINHSYIQNDPYDYNQTSAGDSRFIKLDGNSTTLASIPFVEGINISAGNITMANSTILKLLTSQNSAPLSEGARLSFVDHDGSELGYIRYEDFISGAFRGIVINSTQNIRLIANGADRKIHFEGITSWGDGDGIGLGVGSFDKPDVYLYYNGSTDFLEFDRQAMSFPSYRFQTYIDKNSLVINGSTGDVGIGTITPLAKLGVNGTLSADNITSQTDYFCNSTDCYSVANFLEDSGGNVSFNQSLTDTLYAGIEWDYNQTSAGDNRFLKLDASNDPITSNLIVDSFIHAVLSASISEPSTPTYGFYGRNDLVSTNDMYLVLLPGSLGEGGISVGGGLDNNKFYYDMNTDDWRAKIGGVEMFKIEPTGLTTVGNMTADYYFGDGSQLTGVSGGNLSWNQSLADTLYQSLEDQNLSTTDDVTFDDIVAEQQLLVNENAEAWNDYDNGIEIGVDNDLRIRKQTGTNAWFDVPTAGLRFNGGPLSWGASISDSSGFRLNKAVTSSDGFGMWLSAASSGAGNKANIRGIQLTTTASGTGGSIYALTSANFQTTILSNGETISEAQAVRASIVGYNGYSSTIDNARVIETLFNIEDANVTTGSSLYLKSPTKDTATVGTFHQLYLGDNDDVGTTSWQIYSEGGDNYFGNGTHTLNGTVEIELGGDYVDFAVCYLTSGALGHCTNAVNSTGGCSCVTN